jgi:histone deacetylase 11
MDPELDDWRRQKARRRRNVSVALAFVAAVVLVGLWWFVRLPANPPPRPGERLAVPGSPDAAVLTEAVVAFSPGYRVSFFGIERMHPADVFRADRIAKHLRREGLVPRDAFLVPAPATIEQLAAVHDRDYLASLERADVLAKALEVPVPAAFGAKTLERRVLLPFRRAAGGTIEVARHAAGGGLGINLGGGYHHARPDLGHGFCIYNDVATAIAVLRGEGFDGQVLVVDTDAHQGDGNHAALAGDPSVFTFSMHQGSLFPHPKVSGDLDHALDAGVGDAGFHAALDERLTALISQVEPALIVHVAGCDVLGDDPLTNFAMTPEGLVERDLIVARHAEAAGAGLVHLLAGGYGPSAARAQGMSVAALLRGAWRSEQPR